MVKSRTTQGPLGSEKHASDPKSNGAVFMAAALDMSWRLAFAVLVPIIGGYELDKHLGTLPLLTIIGFLLAMLGLILILKRTMSVADKRFKPKETPR